jgi:cell division protein FtsW
MAKRIFRSSKHPLADWWWRLDRPVLAIVFLLFCFGAAVMSSASAGVAGTYDVGPYYFFKRQLMFLGVSGFAMLTITLFPPKALKPIGVLMLLGTFGMLVLTLIMGVDVKGAQRWLDLGPVSIQASEFLKPSFILVSGWLLSEDEGKGFWQTLGLLAIAALLLFMQPDFGMTMMLVLVWLAQLFLAGVPVVFLMPMVVGGAMCLVLGYVLFPHVRSRLDRFLDPASGDTYQLDKAREAFLSGGLTGRGPGEGVVKTTLPDAHTDFIFAVIGEEFGIFIALLLLIAFGYIVYRSLGRIHDQGDKFTLVAGGGLAVLFALQVLVNVGVTLGVMPTTGMTLPFISYGGSGTLAMAISMGCLLVFLKHQRGTVTNHRKRRTRK